MTSVYCITIRIIFLYAVIFHCVQILNKSVTNSYSFLPILIGMPKLQTTYEQIKLLIKNFDILRTMDIHAF